MTTETAPTVQRCRECGAAVPASRAICPRCRSADLVVDATVRAMGVDAYNRYQRRRRLAVLATVATTFVCMAIALGVGLAFKGVEPGGMRGSSIDNGLMPLVRGLLLLLVINPMVIAALGLVLGLLSYRLWHRLLTGERVTGDFNVLDTLGGRARSR